MKKHDLLKTLVILTLLIIIASYCFVGRQQISSYIGLADPAINYFSLNLQNFAYIFLLVLSVGGFYGVLNKTPAYKKILDNIATKVKPMSKKFIYLIIIIFAITSSLTGMNTLLIIFIPFVASIILSLGYDKLVALSATIVSTMIGYIGGVFVTFLNPNSQTIEIITYEQLVGLTDKFSNTFPKILLLVSGIALLIYFVNKHIVNVENKKVKYELNDDSELLINEVKGSYSDIKTWPLITILIAMFTILVIGIIPWKSLFEVSIFSDFHTWLTGLKIKEFAIIPNIISGSFLALGEWYSSGNPYNPYIYASMLVIFATLIMSLINKVKFNDNIDNFLDGLKKILPAALLVTLACNILICTINNGFLEMIISNCNKFNYGLSSVLALLGSILYVDHYYIIACCFTPIVNLITDETIYASVAILLQGIYGIFSIVGPTSIILIFGLSYFDVPYTTWLKYIWRFILTLVVTLAIVIGLVILL